MIEFRALHRLVIQQRLHYLTTVVSYVGVQLSLTDKQLSLLAEKAVLERILAVPL